MVYGVIILVIMLMSIPVISVKLAYILEKPYLTKPQDTDNVDVVTVLAGGFRGGPEPALDRLSQATYARIVTGVEVYKDVKPGLLVVQGTLRNDSQQEITALMKEIAVEMGVPAGRVIREQNSINTFQHPIELMKIPGIEAGDKIGVVTSAWHLRRAVREFETYFTRIVPFPAEFYSYSLEGGLIDWIPSVYALSDSTTILHELIGMAWYQLKHFRD